MQSRGAIKFFAIVFALVCLFQLSFTFFTTKVENDAESYARGPEAERMAEQLAQGDETLESYMYDSIVKVRENYYLDSISGKDPNGNDIYIYNLLIKKYTYPECKEREINLGLDLKGGMNVMLEIKVEDIIRALSDDNPNATFQDALTMAKQKQRDSQEDFITLFGESFTEIDPNASLATIFMGSADIGDRIDYGSTNEEVLNVIRQETEQAIDRAFKILNTRVNRFGVAQPNIQKLATTGRILVELPGVKDPQRVRKLLQGTASLEFWETWEFTEIQPYLAEANEQLKNRVNIEEILTADPGQTDVLDTKLAQEDTSNIAEEISEGTDLLEGLEEEQQDTIDQESVLEMLEKEEDTTAVMAEDNQMQYARENPLFAFLQPNYYQNQEGNWVAGRGATLGYAQVRDTARVNYLLSKVTDIIPQDVKLAWTVKPDPRSDLMELIALRDDDGAALSGDVITSARQDISEQGEPNVSLSMNSEGAGIWKRLTGQNIGKQIAIVLDGYVYSHPVVNNEIPTGRSVISGGQMSIQEAQDLANILEAGKLPAPARIVEEAVVGPSLGREAINAGLWSFVLAFALVLVYMVLYYNRAGWVADLALLTNIFFLFGVLASLQAVLTLPGIAGIVLTLGMAVDANVIIYERIKEEVRAGKGMRLAIQDGYKNAYSAIIDGNVTTLLTGIVLFVFGSGPVQGFATTLIIGILSSLFSAIFISRLVFTNLLTHNKKIIFDNKLTRNWLVNANFDFLKLRKGAYVISTTIIVIGIGSLIFKGLNFGVDFSGGRTYVVRFDQNVSTVDIRDVLTDQFEGNAPEVKTFGPQTQIKVTTKYMIEEEGTEIDSLVQRKLYAGLKPFYKDTTLKYKDFTADSDVESKLIGILSSQKVGPTIADDIRRDAILAVVIALIVIFAYIAVRFSKWQYGLAGVIALFHDSLITISLFSLFYNVLPFNMEIDQAFIAAILTIIGYSINDTVIIFDRIREYIKLYPKKDMKSNINSALNSTLARTFNTSGTTLVVLIIIFIFGGEIIRGFTFALLMGILIGTYSSLFNASPVAYDLIGEKKEKTPVKKGKAVKRKRK